MDNPTEHPESPKRSSPSSIENLLPAKKQRAETDSDHTIKKSKKEQITNNMKTNNGEERIPEELQKQIDTLGKKHRVKCYRALKMGQKVHIVNSKLVIHPKISLRKINDYATFNDLRWLLMRILANSGKVAKWMDPSQLEGIRKVVLVDIPVLDPTFMGIEASHQTISKCDTPAAYDKLMDKYADFFKHIGLPAFEDDIFVVTASGTYDKRRGIHGRFSQYMQFKLSKGKSKMLKGEHIESNDNTITSEELMMTLQQLREEQVPLHSVLQQNEPLLEGWVETREGTGLKKKLLAIDCEMCKSDQGKVLTKVALINEDHQVILNEFVKPDVPITDYVTKYSGVDAKSLEGVTTTLADIQQKLLQHVDGDTILVGHGIENDLKAVKMRHPYIIDTSVIYHHDNGPPYKAALRHLAFRFLNKRIQHQHHHESKEVSSPASVGDEIGGHDPCEDAITSMELVQLKMKKGLKFGFHGDHLTENILDKVEQMGKTGVVIDAQPYYDSVFERELKAHPHFYAAISNTLAVERAVEEHADKDIVALRLGEEETEDKLKLDSTVTTYLDHVRHIYSQLETDTALILTTGHHKNEHLERLRKKWNSYKGKLKEISLNEIPEDERWTERDEQDISTLIELAKRFFIIPVVKN